MFFMVPGLEIGMPIDCIELITVFQTYPYQQNILQRQYLTNFDLLRAFPIFSLKLIKLNILRKKVEKRNKKKRIRRAILNVH